MNNYKIKVIDAESSAEIQDLFFELGCVWLCSLKEITNLDATYIYAKDGVLTAGFNDLNFAEVGHQELTLPQLRDLVILHRNDVKDATHTHKNFEIAKSIILSATNEVCDWIDDKWKVTCRQVSELKPIQLHPEQGLISGANALNDYSNAQVSYDFAGGEYKWFPLNECGFSIPQILKGHTDADDSFSETKLVFRLKPRTITLSLEIPAPFEPKDGEEYFVINPFQECGYDTYIFHSNGCDHIYVQFGAWRTEEEIKQVVAALRGGIKG